MEVFRLAWQVLPEGLPQKRELEYASRQVNSIEINGSFYSLQRPENYQAWYEATPEDFVFSVKASRFLTHMRRLKDADTALANFLASGLLRLREKLGPILWQLPPNFAYDRARLESFFRIAAADNDGGGWPRATARCKGGRAGVDKGRVRVSIASRLGSASSLFRNRDFITLLREQNIALVVADTAGKWPFFEDATSDFVYMRLHGDTELYVSGYTPSALESWARKVRSWAAGRTPAGAKLVTPRPTLSPRARCICLL